MKLHIRKESKRLKLIVSILLLGYRRLSGLGGRSDLGTLLGLLGAIGQAIGLVLAVLLNESDQVLNGTGSSVLNRGILSTSGVKLDSGEASDGIGHIIGSGVNLGDSNLLIQLRDSGVQCGKLLVLRSKAGDSELEVRQTADELWKTYDLQCPHQGA